MESVLKPGPQHFLAHLASPLNLGRLAEMMIVTLKTYPAPNAGSPSAEEPRPLTAEEVRELDGYGYLSGRLPIPHRAWELWSRETRWGAEGKEYPDPVADVRIP